MRKSRFFEVMGIAVICTIVNTSFAKADDSAQKKVNFRSEQSLRLEDGKDDNSCVSRYSIHRYPVKITENQNLLLSPFWEGDWNFDSEDWYRREIGLEAGLQLTKFLYIGQSFNYIWRDREKFVWPNENEEFSEIENRIELKTRFYDWRVCKAQIYLFNEYLYNIDEGQAYMNVSRVGIMLKINDRVSIPIGWRHADRIHKFDSDHREISVIIDF
ncbi:MAG: hypothetical protein KAX15_01065 [Candidatus Omnitrophica bacterium]|nr:hypothetical protein [Candidatus Omnitrophota bacterium]